MKFVSISKYNTKFKDWDIDCIDQIEKIYNNISKGI